MRKIFVMLFLGQCFLALSQDAVPRIMEMDEYIQIVKNNHPVFYQIDQMGNLASENLRMARGGFDPKFGGSVDAKAFDEKNYYNILDAGVKIPTWIGVDVKAGYERSRGIFLDDSQELPAGGLFYAGISVPLGKGLIIDDRRAELKKAQIFINMNQVEQQIMVNELLFMAYSAYITWQERYQNLEIAREGVVIAQTRFEASVSSFENGDIPAIDTLESLIAVQNRQIDVSKAEQNYVKAVYELNNYLWLDGEQPLELGELTFPELFQAERLEREVDSLYVMRDEMLASHPEILGYEYKLSELDIDRRLAVESLKPDLRIDINPLYEAGQTFLPTENYKYGVAASYPLFLRKERGKLGMTRAKIELTSYDQEIKRNNLKNKLEEYYRLQEQIDDQNILIAESVENYRRMVAAENRKFEIGESSVFLVNSREVKYLESRYKLNEQRAAEAQAKLFFLLYTGVLLQVV